MFSPAFMEARGAFVEELRPKTIVIKERTLRNNYASVFAVRGRTHIMSSQVGGSQKITIEKGRGWWVKK